MALTATATTRKVVIRRLCMEDPVIVYIPPTKANITFSVMEKSSINVVVWEILFVEGFKRIVLTICRFKNW